MFDMGDGVPLLQKMTSFPVFSVLSSCVTPSEYRGRLTRMNFPLFSSLSASPIQEVKKKGRFCLFTEFAEPPLPHNPTSLVSVAVAVSRTKPRQSETTRQRQFLTMLLVRRAVTARAVARATTGAAASARPHIIITPVRQLSGLAPGSPAPSGSFWDLFKAQPQQDREFPSGGVRGRDWRTEELRAALERQQKGETSDTDAVVVDVRDANELIPGRIFPGALHLSLNDGDLERALRDPERFGLPPIPEADDGA
jgi:hypothetical protein